MAVSDRSASIIDSAYNPATFEKAAQLFGQQLRQYLENVHTADASSLTWQPPPQLIAQAQELLDSSLNTDMTPSADQIAERFAKLTQACLDNGHRLHSPHYMGHQVPPPVPLAGLFEAIGSVTNQPMAIYEMGPFATAVERAVFLRLGSYLGWPEGSYDAIGTHGGSLANMTAVMAARNVKYPGVWEDGLSPGGKVPFRGRPAIITGADSHYSVARSVGIIGLGTSQAIKAPLDERRRVCLKGLREAYDRAKEQGADPFCLIGSACSTPVGAFDPLDELADFARERDMWFHVDGAHGASALLSRKHRRLVAGIDKADSVTWDAHKMLFVPALCTFLFYRNSAQSYQAFRQDAPVLFDPNAPAMAAFDPAVRTLECTKRALAFGLWGVWAIFGPELFESLIDRTFELTRTLYELLSESTDFVPLHQPQCNILCFRHVPARIKDAPLDRLSKFQLALRRRMVETGDFYITSTLLDGVATLRVTIMNPHTTRAHFENLLANLRDLGSALELGAGL